MNPTRGPFPRLLGTGAAAALLALTALAAQAEAGGGTAASLAVDLDPAGNTAISLGDNQSCLIVEEGEAFTIDVTVHSVSNLAAWEAYFVYDPAIIEVVDRELKMFLNAEPGSRTSNVSESLPDKDGLYRLGEADLSTPPASESGSGVLSRLSLVAKAPGRTFAGLPAIDVDKNGDIEYGPRLFAPAGQPIGDSDGDAFLDQETPSTQVAVSMDCDEVNPPPVPEVGSPGGGSGGGSGSSGGSSSGSSGDGDGEDGSGTDPDSADGDDSQVAGASGPGSNGDGADSGSDSTTAEDADGDGVPDNVTAITGSLRSDDGMSPWLVGALSAAAVLTFATLIAFLKFARTRPL